MDQVAHVTVNIWEEALHPGQVVVSTVESMATGQGTVRLVTGKTNAIAVVKGAISKEIARTALGVSGAYCYHSCAPV